MKKADLIELAGNPDFISGIYNYCDRWCERCQFTSRCFLYATEQADDDLADPETRDISNEKFWRKLQDIFTSTAELIADWAAEAGVDLDAMDTAEVAKEREQKKKAIEQSELGRASKDYAFAVEQWFKKELSGEDVLEIESAPDSDSDEEALTIQNAIEVIRWYQFFIAAKTHRALSGSANPDFEMEDDEELPDIFAFDEDQEDDDFDYDAVMVKVDRMDAHGSAKVALVATDRSISAWRSLQISLPAKTDSIKPLLIDLESLRRSMEARFPHARDFIRPGLDEVNSRFVS